MKINVNNLNQYLTKNATGVMMQYAEKDKSIELRSYVDFSFVGNGIDEEWEHLNANITLSCEIVDNKISWYIANAIFTVFNTEFELEECEFPAEDYMSSIDDEEDIIITIDSLLSAAINGFQINLKYMIEDGRMRIDGDGIYFRI